MEEERVDESPADQVEQGTPPPHSDLVRKIGALGWGLFFIWIGIALLAEVGTGAGLLGVGIITIAVQIARKVCGVKVEGFWILVGLLFVGGGIAGLLNTKLPWPPIVAIAAGLALIISIFTGKCCSRR